MRERLRIGEVARLVSVTTKTVRHYEKVGLLQQTDRSDAGYRLYTADDLLRVHRIKQLRSLGLPLQRIKEVLGGSGSGEDLRGVLEAVAWGCREETRGSRRTPDRLKEMLSRDDLEDPDYPPQAFKLAEEHLGDLLKYVSPSVLQQEKRLWATIESLDWPASYVGRPYARTGVLSTALRGALG